VTIVSPGLRRFRFWQLILLRTCIIAAAAAAATALLPLSYMVCHSYHKLRVLFRSQVMTMRPAKSCIKSSISHNQARGFAVMMLRRVAMTALPSPTLPRPQSRYHHRCFRRYYHDIISSVDVQPISSLNNPAPTLRLFLLSYFPSVCLLEISAPDGSIT
jgi:hypothetical protein